jgi:hypothetical protein
MVLRRKKLGKFGRAIPQFFFWAIPPEKIFPQLPPYPPDRANRTANSFESVFCLEEL